MKTFKTFCKRGMRGIGISIFAMNCVQCIVSLILHDGTFYAAPLKLIMSRGSELAAVVFQFVVNVIFGFIYGIAAGIWEHDTWGIVKQAAIHFAITCTAYLLAGWFCFWYERSIQGMLIGAVVFFVIYVIICLVIMSWQHVQLKKINKKISCK